MQKRSRGNRTPPSLFFHEKGRFWNGGNRYPLKRESSKRVPMFRRLQDSSAEPVSILVRKAHKVLVSGTIRSLSGLPKLSQAGAGRFQGGAKRRGYKTGRTTHSQLGMQMPASIVDHGMRQSDRPRPVYIRISQEVQGAVLNEVYLGTLSIPLVDMGCKLCPNKGPPKVHPGNDTLVPCKHSTTECLVLTHSLT